MKSWRTCGDSSMVMGAQRHRALRNMSTCELGLGAPPRSGGGRAARGGAPLACHALVSFRSRFRAASTSTSADAVVKVKGPKGELSQHILGERRRDHARERRAARRAQERREVRALGARPDAHADQQHDRGRDQRLSQEPRAARRRLPRQQGRQRPELLARLLAPGRLQGAGWDHVRRRGHDQSARRRDRQAAGRPSRRRDPQLCVRPSRTKARACATRARVVRKKLGKAGKAGKK